jgi:hypothetical protein
MIRAKKGDYLEAIRKRYRKSEKVKKQAILDEFCEVCGYNRKYAIRLLILIFTHYFFSFSHASYCKVSVATALSALGFFGHQYYCSKEETKTAPESFWSCQLL